MFTHDNEDDENQDYYLDRNDEMQYGVYDN